MTRLTYNEFIDSEIVKKLCTKIVNSTGPVLVYAEMTRYEIQIKNMNSSVFNNKK